MLVLSNYTKIQKQFLFIYFYPISPQLLISTYSCQMQQIIIKNYLQKVRFFTSIIKFKIYLIFTSYSM
ncbi:unnamed protein product [Paramecium sonneborni]|uniref:Uncharacterized protein n=1 Tax=Paramecium sonneborni TaxID=65129 RepID=A0A8S1KI07_9CILI|nr:unnamed protein product [Paramecium sonneborni]